MGQGYSKRFDWCTWTSKHNGERSSAAPCGIETSSLHSVDIRGFQAPVIILGRIAGGIAEVTLLPFADRFRVPPIWVQ